MTSRQEKFCQEYVKTGSKTEAYRLSYSTENMKPETVNNNAYKLSENNEIITRIDELQKEAENISKEEFGVDVKWVLSELVTIAKESNTKDRVSALDKIMKHLGGYERNNEQLASSVTFELKEVFGFDKTK